MGSMEILGLVAQQKGGYLLDELGAAHRDDLKLRTVTVKTADGCDIVTVAGDPASQIIDDLIRGGLVSEAAPLDEKYRRIYRLTPDGLERGKAVKVA
jgi:hypothetical protein